MLSLGFVIMVVILNMYIKAIVSHLQEFRTESLEILHHAVPYSSTVKALLSHTLQMLWNTLAQRQLTVT
jgi:hypothetical protein